MTVVNNIALSVGGSLSAALADAFGITLENFENLWALTLFTSLSTLIPIILIPMVPEGVEDCEESADAVDESTGEAGGENEGSMIGEMRRMRRASSGGQVKNIARSKTGGALFLTVLFVGLLYSIINAGIMLAGGENDNQITFNGGTNISTIDGMNSSNSTFKWACTLEAIAEEEENKEDDGKDE
jgi:hypothetical protein